LVFMAYLRRRRAACTLLEPLSYGLVRAFRAVFDDGIQRPHEAVANSGPLF